MAESTNDIPDWIVDQGIEIDQARAALGLAVNGLIVASRKAGLALGALHRAYDVEIVETDAGVTMTNALSQIDVAIAALRHLAPEPGQ